MKVRAKMLTSRFCQADEQVKKLLVTYFSNVLCYVVYG